MDLQALAWFGAAIVSALTIYNTVMAAGQKRGATDVQLLQLEDNEKAWNRRFDLHHAALEAHKTITDERLTKVMAAVNEALLQMARNHPTKADLLESERRIIERVDMLISRKVD